MLILLGKADFVMDMRQAPEGSSNPEGAMSLSISIELARFRQGSKGSRGSGLWRQMSIATI